jgi:hypothetical protein
LFAGAAQLPLALEWLENLAAGGRTEPLAVARSARQSGSRLVLWLSDFLPLASYRRPLALLGSGRTSVHGILPVVADDQQLDSQGWLRVRDPETGEVDDFRVDGAFRRGMVEELRQHRLRLEAMFGGLGHRLVQHPLPQPGNPAPAAWLPRL